MISELFSNLNGSMILWFYLHQQSKSPLWDNRLGLLHFCRLNQGNEAFKSSSLQRQACISAPHTPPQPFVHRTELQIRRSRQQRRRNEESSGPTRLTKQNFSALLTGAVSFPSSLLFHLVPINIPLGLKEPRLRSCLCSSFHQPTITSSFQMMEHTGFHSCDHCTDPLPSCNLHETTCKLATTAYKPKQLFCFFLSGRPQKRWHLYSQTHQSVYQSEARKW